MSLLECADVVLDNLHTAFARLQRCPRDVRCHQTVRLLNQRRIVNRRLFFQHIDAGIAHLAACQRIGKVEVIDDSAASGVDDDDPLLHLGNAVLANHLVGFFC